MTRRRQIRASISIRLGNATETFEASAEIDHDADADDELERLFRTLQRQKQSIESAGSVQTINFQGIGTDDN